MAVPRILVDRCTFDHGVLARAVTQEQSVQWGPHTVSWPVQMYQGKSRPSAEGWLRAEIRAIAALAAAARRGELTVFSSFELDAERLRGRRKPHGRRVDLWDGVPVGTVPPALDRSRWMGCLGLKDVASRDHQHAFVVQLCQWPGRPMPEDVLDALQAPALERANLARLPELVALCNAVGETRYVDAFHFWTALCNDLDYFLTSDRKFLDSLRAACLSGDIVCRAVSAAELVEVLDLPPTPPPILEGELVHPFAVDS